MSNAHGGTAERIERGVYRRITNGKDEFGSRADDLSGRTKWIWGFPTVAKARQDYQARRATVRKSREAGGEMLPTKATIRELSDLYLTTIQHKLASYSDQRQHLKWWSDHFKNQPVLTIQPIDVERGTSCLIGSGLSKATANRYCSTLRHLMRKMVSPLSWVLEFWKRVEFFNEETDRKIRHPLTEEQEDRLYTQLDLQDALYVRLDILIGIRLSHFFSLRWEYLWWSQSVMHLPAIKRHPARLLPLPQEAMAILAILWEQQRQPTEGWIFPVRKMTAIGAGYKHWGVGPIVVNPEKHMNQSNWYRRRFRPAVLASGIPGDVTFHTLRHTWASRMGPHTPSRILQILGGWKDMKLVERYCQPFEGAMRTAMEQGATKPVQSVGEVSSDYSYPTGKLLNILKKHK